MNDEETVALIAGGHTFGKTHGAVDGDQYVGAEPEGASLEEQGLGWKNSYSNGNGVHTTRAAWKAPGPTTRSSGTTASSTTSSTTSGADEEPAGAHQWTPKDASAVATVPDAHDPSQRHAPMMLTTDLSLRLDPIYGPISKRFHENPDEFAEAFAKAWYKLTHRDMGRSLATSAPR